MAGPTIRELPKPEIQKIPETPELGNPEASNLQPEQVTQRNSIAADNPQPTPKKGPGRPIDPNSKRQQQLNNLKPTTVKPAVAAKVNVGPPDFSEWQKFIGGVVIHWMTYAMASVILRGIDRANLTDDEREDIELDEEEEMAIAAPFSKLMIGSKLNGKYGRAIINAKDTIEATVILFFYVGRLNRVAKKYRPKHSKQTILTSNVERPQNVTDLRAARIERTGNPESEASEAPTPPVWNGGQAGFYTPQGTGFN